jgi:hypothetical protein
LHLLLKRLLLLLLLLLLKDLLRTMKSNSHLQVNARAASTHIPTYLMVHGGGQV